MHCIHTMNSKVLAIIHSIASRQGYCANEYYRHIKQGEPFMIRLV
jgi:hypothetical protein